MNARAVTVCIAWGMATSLPPAAAQTPGGLPLTLKLRTQGEIQGTLLEQNDYGIALLHASNPYAFSWRELEFASAMSTRRAILVQARGGQEHVTAEDYFGLGLFALRLGRNDAAVHEFRQAQRLDRTLAPRITEAYRAFRERTRGAREEEPFDVAETLPAATAQPAPSSWTGFALTAESPEAVTEQVLAVYKQFGEKAREVLGADLVAIESEHFLIWTDWEKPQRDRLAEWCEAMYAALCRQFDIPVERSVFLAKCPVFCFRSRERFRTFARLFDGYDGSGAAGYTRSIESNGHTHVVLLRQGKGRLDMERFAGTLVHEGTHAFVHRLYSHRLIPPWVNEGLAELIVERVLDEASDTREMADLLARQYVRLEVPLGGLLASAGPLEVPQYALAHSLVADLEARGAPSFAAFLRALKQGATTTEALGEAYNGLTPEQWEAQWRATVRSHR